MGNNVLVRKGPRMDPKHRHLLGSKIQTWIQKVKCIHVIHDIDNPPTSAINITT